MPDVSQYLDLYNEAKSYLGDRTEAYRRFEQIPLLDDVFMKTDYGINVQRIPIEVDVAKSFGCDVPSVTAAPAVVVNDIFSAPKRLEERLPKGVRFMSLRRATKECPELLNRFEGGLDNEETRLNDMLWSDGVLLYVEAGVKLSKPLQLVNIFSSPIDLMAIRRMIIHIGKDAEAQLLVCDHTQDSLRKYLSAESIQITLEDNARFGFDIIEESSANTIRRTSLSANVGVDAQLECTAATLSCGDSKVRVHVDLTGSGACVRLNGLVIADKEQKASYAICVNHHAEHTESNQLFKFVADELSSCSFTGKIVVGEKARFTEAYQTNRNLLVSDNAKMHSEPALEIYCDEVKCSHGATTGQLDQAALFYMQQRGIPEELARRMLMEAFVGDVIDTVHVPGLRDRLHHLVERRFSGLGSDVASCADCDLQKITTQDA